MNQQGPAGALKFKRTKPSNHCCGNFLWTLGFFSASPPTPRPYVPPMSGGSHGSSPATSLSADDDDGLLPTDGNLPSEVQGVRPLLDEGEILATMGEIRLVVCWCDGVRGERWHEGRDVGG
jgi:hypothetical protein